MTRLFVLFYLGVLIVLFLAWYIHGAVLKQRTDAEWARVVEEAHGGGARLVARKLGAGTLASRDAILNNLRERFDYPLDVRPLASLPSSLQRRISHGNNVAYDSTKERQGVVVAALPNSGEVVCLGPFPNYDLRAIEESIAGWMQLTADDLNAAAAAQRPALLAEIQDQFDFPVDIVGREDLPSEPKERIIAGAKVAFYEQAEGRWFAATPLSTGKEVVRGGPFPNFKRVEQKAATTTLALVLLPAALAIALLLRPVARQLRHVENAAKAIAAGDLGARVDERRVFSARPLAQAFNDMASRTETLVRTQRELLQAVSHELRTPLSRIRFAIDLIEAAKDNAERKQRLDSLDAATEELDELVGELLRYVRMETAKPQLNRESLAVQDTLKLVVPKYAALHPTIDFSNLGQGGDDEIAVFADRQGFQRVLGNLLSNAGRFAKSKVTVSTSSSGATTIMDIDDDGTGIAESDRRRVLEPFVRLDDLANRNGPGVGLGLALVRRIVIQHGGSVEVLKSPLGGCRVRTTWPAESP